MDGVGGLGGVECLYPERPAIAVDLESGFLIEAVDRDGSISGVTQVLSRLQIGLKLVGRKYGLLMGVGMLVC